MMSFIDADPDTHQRIVSKVRLEAIDGVAG
jgi:hypothetical protein